MSKWILIILFFISSLSYADEIITLDLQRINLVDALHAFAKQTKQNILISPNVSGNVTLHLDKVSAQNAMQVMLATQNLSVATIGNVLFIAPREEIDAKNQALQDAKRKHKLAQQQNEPLVTKLFAIRFARAKDILHFLQSDNHFVLSDRGQMQIDERTNQLAIRDVARKIIFIQKIINKLDVPLQQVMIEAHLASVDSDFEQELGINFNAESFTNNDVNPKHFSLAYAQLANGTYLNVALAAMEDEGRGELISSPSLFTMNHETAVIESGEEIPYQEISLSGGTGVAFKKAVLSLKVTPQILPGGKILLELQVNQDRPSSHIIQGVPAISTRQITTHVLVNNGQTLVLGGIFELNHEHNEQRVPFLGKIPILGRLFSDHDIKRNKRELLIFVRPKIIN